MMAPGQTSAATSETEPRPVTDARPVILFGLLLMALLLGGLGTWAATAPLDSAIVAPGTVIVESNRKTIQHLEGGIVEAIMVDEGQAVQAGDVLVHLDRTRTAAVQALTRRKLDEALALRARLDAEQRGLDDITFPDELLRRAEDQPTVRAILDGQRQQFIERRRSVEGQIDILEKRINQLEDEIAGMAAKLDAQSRQRAIFEEELVGLRELFEKGYYPRSRVLALEREVAELDGAIGTTRASIARAEKSIGEAELRIIQTRQEFREKVLDADTTVQNTIEELREQLVVARDSLDRGTVRAPLDGTVQNLQVHTTGGVIRPGEVIMELVPRDDRLVIEARVSPTDIDMVRPNMEAEVRLTALNLRRTPIILGRVASISPDRIVDTETEDVYFRAEIVVPDSELEKLEDRTLSPGMPADVIVKTGERTVIDYLIKPLTDYFAAAMTEQ